MESISLKLDKTMLQNIDKNLKEHNFSTRTEFIRAALRSRLESLKREKLIEEFMKFRGKANKKTTREENKNTADKILYELAKEKGWEN